MAKDKWGYDWDATARDYADYRMGYPDGFFENLITRGIGLPGESVVDLATGPGTLARGFARRGCSVIAVDLAGKLIDEARRLDRTAGVEIDYRVAPAEQTGLPGACANVVISGNSWSWFPAATREARRLLKPGGVLVITYSNLDLQPENLATITLQLTDSDGKHGLLCYGQGSYKIWMEELRQDGFGIEKFRFDFEMKYTHEAWRGFHRAAQWTGASMTPEALAEFDEKLAALLREKYPAELNVPIMTVGIICRPPANK